jgi:hypothetical protein
VDVEHEEMVALTTIIVKDKSRLFCRIRGARLACQDVVHPSVVDLAAQEEPPRGTEMILRRAREPKPNTFY